MPQKNDKRFSFDNKDDVHFKTQQMDKFLLSEGLMYWFLLYFILLICQKETFINIQIQGSIIKNLDLKKYFLYFKYCFCWTTDTMKDKILLQEWFDRDFFQGFIGSFLVWASTIRSLLTMKQCAKWLGKVKKLLLHVTKTCPYVSYTQQGHNARKWTLKLPQ